MLRTSCRAFDLSWIVRPHTAVDVENRLGLRKERPVSFRKHQDWLGAGGADDGCRFGCASQEGAAGADTGGKPSADTVEAGALDQAPARTEGRARQR